MGKNRHFVVVFKIFLLYFLNHALCMAFFIRKNYEIIQKNIYIEYNKGLFHNLGNKED